MKILLAEDERKSALFLKRGLSEHGAAVDWVEDGDSALAAAESAAYDILILDVMLPKRDGWSVLTELRSHGSHLPVLFLTARDSVQDRVRGLEAGADDYLVKPFAFSELLARVHNLLRRRSPRLEETLRVMDLELDPRQRRAVRGGKKLDLTPKEFQLLVLMASHPGEALTRANLAEQVWDMNFDSDSNVIDVHVRRLRAKVDDPFDIKLIHTVRGVGYRLGGDD